MNTAMILKARAQYERMGRKKNLQLARMRLIAAYAKGRRARSGRG